VNTEARIGPAIICLAGGFVIWMGHFLFIYSFTGLACARPDWAGRTLIGQPLIPSVIGIATAVALAALLLVVVRARANSNAAAASAAITDPRFSQQIALGGAGLATIAVLWQGLFSILTVPACY
jgi:uncharacterized membrane protein YeiB